MAYGEATDAVQPGMGALDHPAVTTQALAALHPKTGDAGLDAAGAALAAAAPAVVAFVNVQLVGAPSQLAASAAAHRRHGIQLSCWLAGPVSTPRGMRMASTAMRRLLPALP